MTEGNGQVDTHRIQAEQPATICLAMIISITGVPAATCDVFVEVMMIRSVGMNVTLRGAMVLARQSGIGLRNFGERQWRRHDAKRIRGGEYNCRAYL